MDIPELSEVEETLDQVKTLLFDLEKRYPERHRARLRLYQLRISANEAKYDIRQYDEFEKNKAALVEQNQARN